MPSPINMPYNLKVKARRAASGLNALIKVSLNMEWNTLDIRCDGLGVVNERTESTSFARPVKDSVCLVI